jgi:hypothetical protein
MPEAKCYLYDLVVPEPETIRAETWNRTWAQMEESKWVGERGRRVGFVSVIQHVGLIAGFFANEGQKRGIQYNDDKQPINAATFSFEHLFFLVFTDTSQILLQHRNIYGYDDLNLPVMRENFLRSLADLLRMSGVSVVGDRAKIEPAGAAFSHEELYAFFTQNSALGVEISNLTPERIPSSDDPRYRLYNPKDEWNSITWGAVAETLKVGTRAITFQASEDDPAAALNKGPLPKAFATIGEIDEVKARTGDGRIVVRKKSSDEEITIELPTEPSISTPALEVILSKFDTQTRVESWHKRIEKRKREQFKGTMFDPNPRQSE